MNKLEKIKKLIRTNDMFLSIAETLSDVDVSKPFMVEIAFKPIKANHGIDLREDKSIYFYSHDARLNTLPHRVLYLIQEFTDGELKTVESELNDIINAKS
jgi:hypothetical protein